MHPIIFCRSVHGLFKHLITVKVEHKLTLVLLSGETEVRISGPAEQFVQAGSTVTFTCVVRAGGSAVRPQTGLAVAWFHGSRPVSARQPQRAVSVDTERGEGGATSRLILANVEHADAGNYTCVAAATAPEARAASVALVIVEGM